MYKKDWSKELEDFAREYERILAPGSETPLWQDVYDLLTRHERGEAEITFADIVWWAQAYRRYEALLADNAGEIDVQSDIYDKIN